MGPPSVIRLLQALVCWLELAAWLLWVELVLPLALPGLAPLCWLVRAPWSAEQVLQWAAQAWGLALRHRRS